MSMVWILLLFCPEVLNLKHLLHSVISSFVNSTYVHFLAAERDFSVVQIYQNSSGIYLVSCSMGTTGYISEVKCA
jgi:hypothetical protein